MHQEMLSNKWAKIKFGMPLSNYYSDILWSSGYIVSIFFFLLTFMTLEGAATAPEIEA